MRPAHGGAIPRELAALAIQPADVLDLSANLNPYGPHPAMLEAIRGAPVDRYPDPEATAARHALAGVAGVAASRVVVGAGAAELLWTLARVLLAPGDTALVVEPAFSELRRAASAAGARLAEWRARPDDGFAIDVAAVAERVATLRPRLLSLGSPNNPTAATVAPADVAALARAQPRTWIALDESYLGLSEAHEDAAFALPDNVVRVRSLTKEHAIPGVRVGYLIAPVELVARIEAARPAWPTSAATQAAAAVAPSLAGFVAQSRARLLADRDRMLAAVRALGVCAFASRAAFFLVRAPDGDATALRDRLLMRHRVLVRDASSFGLPDLVRVAACREREAERFFAALRSEVAAGGTPS